MVLWPVLFVQFGRHQQLEYPIMGKNLAESNHNLSIESPTMPPTTEEYRLCIEPINPTPEQSRDLWELRNSIIGDSHARFEFLDQFRVVASNHERLERLSPKTFECLIGSAGVGPGQFGVDRRLEIIDDPEFPAYFAFEPSPVGSAMNEWSMSQLEAVGDCIADVIHARVPGTEYTISLCSRGG